MTAQTKEEKAGVVWVENTTVTFIYRIITVVLAILGEGILFYYNDFGSMLVYFTNQTNLMILALFLALTIGDILYLFVWKKNKSFHLPTLLEMALTAYIMVTFLGYWILLSGTDFSMSTTDAVKSTLTRISNYIIHGVVPILALIHFIFFSEHGKMNYLPSLKLLVYPIFYLVFILVRAQLGGPISGDSYYPYYFVDVDQLGVGYFILVVIAFILFFALLGLLFVFVDKKLTKMLKKKREKKETGDTNSTAE